MRGRWIVGALILGIFVTSTGCTSFSQWWHNGAKVGPEYCRPGADVSPEWRETGSPELKTGVSEEPCWWAKFNDPVLNDLIATLHRQNLTLKTAAMRICEARAIRGIAVGNLFPQQQSMDGAYDRSAMSKNTQFGSTGFLDLFTSDWTLGFGMAWELDFWGKYRRMVTSADDNLEATIYTYDNAMVLLQAELAATYIQYRTLGERIRLAKQNVVLQKKTVQIVQDRLDAGLVGELDLRQAKAQLFTTESIIPNLETARRKAENRICVLLGMPPVNMSETLNVSRSIPMPPPEVAIGIPAELLMRRPDVLAAERKLAAQSERIGIAEADLYPHISIAGQIGLESQEYRDLFQWDSITGRIVPGFKWDVLNYGRLLSKIDVEDARFHQALWEYRNTVLTANEEVENSLTGYLQEQIRLRKLAASVTETEKAYQLATLQYSEGVTDFQRVLDSQTGLVLRQDQLAESRGLVAVNLVMVYKSLGGGWRCPCPGNPVPVDTGVVQPSGELVPTPENGVPTPAPQVPVLPMPQVPMPQVPMPQTPAAPQVPSTLPPGLIPSGSSAGQVNPNGGGTIRVLYQQPMPVGTAPVRSQGAMIPAGPSGTSPVVPMSYVAPSATPLPQTGTTARLPRVEYPSFR